MKKITLLFIFCIGFALNCYAQFPEGFEGTTIPAGWTTYIGTNGLGTAENWKISNLVANSGVNCILVQDEDSTPDSNEDWLVTPQFTVDATNHILSFFQREAFGAEYGTVYTIRVSTGASQTTHADFTIIDTQAESDLVTVFGQHTVDLTAYIGTSIYVAFVQEEVFGDYWIIDDVDMIPNATAPDAVTTPAPADMAMDVAVDAANTNAVAISWTPATTGDPATGFKIAYGTDPSTLPILGTIGATGVNITGNDYSTTYYWQITPSNVGGEGTPSPIWSFTTEADPTLSTSDFEIQNSFTVFPNPVENILNIKSESILTSVEIYNQLGQRVMNLNQDKLTSNSINVENLNDGIYLINISSEDKKQTIKFIKK